MVHVTDREQFLLPNGHPEMLPDSVLEIGYSFLDKVRLSVGGRVTQDAYFLVANRV